MKDYFGYNEKVCVVTGASSGMGEATARMLVDLGARVYAIDLNECKVEGITKFIKCNLAKKEEIDEAFKEIPEHIDSFFGVAGLSGAKTDYRTTFDCNYTANMYITLFYLKNRMSKGGSIVYCTSTAGLEWKRFKKEQNKVVHAKTWEEVQDITRKIANSAPATFAYMYSKRCTSQFACEQSVEFAKLGIRVNNVLPGSTNTGMKQEFQDMVGSEENLIAQAGLAGRLATPEEMAGPMVFLNSDMASFISGLDMVVDYTDTCLKVLGIKKNIEAVSATNPLICALAKKMMAKQANGKALNPGKEENKK
jgi:NAD(P)-dependent dehydrogenase (short-subunit alcohol dehydrogenase family)